MLAFKPYKGYASQNMYRMIGINTLLVQISATGLFVHLKVNCFVGVAIVNSWARVANHFCPQQIPLISLVFLWSGFN